MIIGDNMSILKKFKENQKIIDVLTFFIWFLVGFILAVKLGAFSCNCTCADQSFLYNYSHIMIK